MASESLTAAGRDSLRVLLSTDRPIDCADYTFNAKRLIPRLYAEGKADSIDLILEFVASMCSDNLLERFSWLLAIERHRPLAATIDSNIMYQILLPSGGLSCGFGLWYESKSWEKVSVPAFDSLVTALARKLAVSSAPYSRERLICTFYAGGRDTLLDLLNRGMFKGLPLQENFDTEIRDLLKERESVLQIAASGGAWVPLDANDVLGPKIEIGGQVGARRDRLGADLTLLMRFLKARQTYLISQHGELRRTNYFFGGYVGVDPNLTLISTLRFRTELFGGIGWDGFTAIGGDDGKTVNSLCLNAGLTQRFFYGKSRSCFFGFQGRYSVVRYDTHGGTDLSGNTLSVSLIWGYMEHGFANWRLTDLRYIR